ncbi:MAG TPA: protein kinase [Thermoanaerobaculia bacterium]|nr:protein kinase [Thermoanaerobaculia bacterium]
MPELVGHYRILESLGSGGMGDVWRARRLDDDAIVALKTIRADRLPDAESRERFAREAAVLERLEHPSIARVLDAGVEPMPFIAMELLGGETLAARLARGRMNVPEALACTAAVAEALAFAHAHGVVHRDVKPSNIHLDGERVVLSDFGIAFLPGETRVTRTGALIGTAAYIAPELVREQEPVPASDVYSLGVVLFEMLTGELPFRAEGATLLAAARLMYPPLAPGELRPGLPKEVQELVLRCLAMKPEHRPAASELAELARGAKAPRRRRAWLYVAGAIAAAAIALFLAQPSAKVERASARRPSTLGGLKPAAPPAIARSESLKVSLLALGANTPADYEATRNLTKVTAANPGFGVADPAREFRVGDRIAVVIESSTAGWLYVLNAGSDGITRNIEQPRATRVDADTPRILGPFEVEPPSGVDTVTLLLTRERIAALEQDGDLGDTLRAELARRPYGSARRSEHHALFFEDAGTGRIVATVPVRHRER